MELLAPSGTSLATRKVVNGLVITGLALVLIIAGVFPALAQDTTYTDASGQFTVAIPAGWADESTPEYGLFTKSGVSFYLTSVEDGDVQAAIVTAVSLLAPDLAGTTPTPDVTRVKQSRLITTNKGRDALFFFSKKCTKVKIIF